MRVVYFNVIIYILPAQGIGQVKTGQDVKVRLDNYPDREFGYLTGKVHDVAYIPDDNGLYQVNIFFLMGLKPVKEIYCHRNAR